ncbi:MAG: amidohydrolase family protein [Planctomycetota bacterium]
MPLRQRPRGRADSDAPRSGKGTATYFGTQFWLACAFALLASLCAADPAWAQLTPVATPAEKNAPSISQPTAPDPPSMAPPPQLSLSEFDPFSQLRVPVTRLTSAAHPVIDVHTHFFNRLRHNAVALDDFVEVMDRNRIALCVSLDGRLGDRLDSHRKFLWDKYPDRFAIFTNVNWRGSGSTDAPETWACHRSGFAKRTAESIRNAVQNGVCGLKIFKGFGLGYQNPDGSLIEIDDARWNPIWAVCGELGIPVIIHTADPAAFFQPIDKRNERWEELSRHPNWSFHGDRFPSRESLLQARNRVIERHPRTQFIGAHMANNPEDLATVSQWLDRYPNLWVEISSRIAELGRQPYSAREFLIRHSDRVLFGTDGPWPEERLGYYWRFLETRDQSFRYSEKSPPPQGLWQIHGVYLPDDVLRKIYFENAWRLIPGVQEKYQAAIARWESSD